MSSFGPWHYRFKWFLTNIKECLIIIVTHVSMCMVCPSHSFEYSKSMQNNCGSKLIDNIQLKILKYILMEWGIFILLIYNEKNFKNMFELNRTLKLNRNRLYFFFFLMIITIITVPVQKYFQKQGLYFLL